jgi:uncharacterized protein YjbJ (UPF0337 family)
MHGDCHARVVRADIGQTFGFIHWCGGCNPEKRRYRMNQDTLEGQWKQLKGKLREQWGKLTDDDWDAVAGKKDQLVGKIQERYGYSREEAERHYSDWEKANMQSSKVA